MARIRTIKPEFWTDEKILESSPIARLLLIGLLNFADDKGNIEAGPLSIKTKIFPGDDIKVEPLLSELQNNLLLIPYAVNGERYYNIKGFSKHQKIDNPSKPRCPIYDDSMSPLVEIVDDSTQEVVSSKGSSKGLNPSCSDSEESKPKKWNDWDLRMANWMIKDIRQIAPNHNFHGGTPESFADVFRLMRERDGLREDDIEQVWAWANHDSFWRSNILSPHSLRKKFSQLKLKMVASEGQPAAGTKTGQAYDGIPKEEPMEHNDLAKRINVQIKFAQEHLNDDDWEGAKPDTGWLNRTVGNMILEYSERWPKGPYMRQFVQKFGDLSSKVLEMEAHHDNG